MEPNPFKPDRLAAIEADVAAANFAEVTVTRGYGGQFSTQWSGDSTWPVKVAAEMKSDPALLSTGLVFVRDLDDRAAIFAKP